MKKIFFLLAVLCMAGCKNSSNSVAIEYETLASYEDIDKAIGQLVQPGNWNEEDCTTIDARINACKMYALIDAKQSTALKQKLNSYSNKYLFEGVDELFRKTSYQGLDFWKSMLAYMQKQYDNYTAQQIPLASANMKKAQIIIDDYKKVCSWANASGYATPEFLSKYPVNIANAVLSYHDKIKNEPNYQTYFKANTDLKKAMDGMQARMEASRVKYYDGLEKLVEEYIVKNELTEEEALDLQIRFNALDQSASHSSAAISKLQDFVDDYITKLMENENESSSVKY